LNQPGCFASESFSGFLHAAASRLFEVGMLRLHWIEMDGRPIAAEFHLANAGVTYTYQSGIDPDSLADEPGRMMHVVAIKEAIETGQRAFDFLRGDEPYKAHWRGEPRPSVEYRIAAKHSVAQIRHGIWLAGNSVKQLIKSSLGFVGAS
jgi:CelD/BcsL family acetyltransferase involved in cellulose biosynthesis